MNKYLGFDLQAMLYRLGMYCEKVEIVLGGSEFRVTILSDEFGEFEKVGSLFSTVTQAFKPFADRAAKDMGAAKMALDLVMGNLGDK